MMKIVCLLVAVSAAVSANVVANGNCPELKPVENFNVSAYTGLWYEVSKFPYASEKKGKCATAEYKLEDGVVKVKNTHIIDGAQIAVEGTAKLAPDANNAGKLIVSLKFGDITRDSPLTVLATDYSNYAIAYNCRYDEKNKNHQEFAWVLSRSKTLEGAAKNAVDEFFKATPQLDATKLQQTDFSEDACKFEKSSLITEKPSA